MLSYVRHWLHLLTYTLRTMGPLRLLRHAPRYLIDREARTVDSGFDSKFGTDTTSSVTPREAGLATDRRDAATLYMPSMDCDLHGLLAALDWSNTLLRSATFVDLGSGKGRAVLLAAMRKFQRVVGVELSPVLHLIAERNLDAVAQQGVLESPVDLVLSDATRYDLPDGPVVVYLYHPFGEPIANLVLDRVRASIERNPRPVAVLYCHPTLQPPLDASVFARGNVLRQTSAGGRQTRSFYIGYTVWTNDAWLAARALRPARAPAQAKASTGDTPKRAIGNAGRLPATSQ